jgi:hypothetical protein
MGISKAIKGGVFNCFNVWLLHKLIKLDQFEYDNISIYSPC